jgi:hypothetical protein
LWKNNHFWAQSQFFPASYGTQIQTEFAKNDRCGKWESGEKGCVRKMPENDGKRSIKSILYDKRS